jgi:hypothetical protein
MLARCSFVLIGIAAAVAFSVLTLPEQSLAQDVRHMCSEKYRAAKAEGTLGDEIWPQFYSRCSAEMKANPPAAATTPPATEAAPAPLDIRHICGEKYQTAKAAGTLGGESWPQFYSRCTAETKANPPAAAAPAAEAAPPAEEAPKTPPPAPVVEAPTPPPAPVAETPAPPPVAAPEPKPTAPVNPLKKPAAKPAAPAAATAPSAAPAASGPAVFPTAIAPEFANEKPAKARMKTCDAQYKANKANNANGGLKWIQKGGGYWSECNKKLKEEHQ